MNNNLRIGDKFIVVTQTTNSYWQSLGYHKIGWKGVVTDIEESQCKWLGEYYFADGMKVDSKEPISFDICCVKKISIKKISCFAYWMMVYGK
jgi:hypothetical protein